MAGRHTTHHGREAYTHLGRLLNPVIHPGRILTRLYTPGRLLYPPRETNIPTQGGYYTPREATYLPTQGGYTHREATYPPTQGGIYTTVRHLSCT